MELEKEGWMTYASQNIQKGGKDQYQFYKRDI